jgi:glycosyltransferase involved in cell wall biosynthesis
MMALLKATGMKARLHMAGNGLKIPAMKEAIARYGLENEVILLGHLSPDQVANELRSAHALLHCSDYETYSAVCAESLCMGTPVIASNVGGIVEYMTHDTGAMVQKNDPALWCEVVRGSWERTLQADRKAIAGYMHGRASTASVGARYHAALQKFMTDDPVASHDG